MLTHGDKREKMEGPKTAVWRGIGKAARLWFGGDGVSLSITISPTCTALTWF